MEILLKLIYYEKYKRESTKFSQSVSLLQFSTHIDLAF